MIEDARGRIDYGESGHGATMVLVPGSCSTGAAWRPIIAQWNNGFRCVTTSLLGFTLMPALLASIETPTRIMWGGLSHPAIARANLLLGRCMPNASVATLDGAAHFMIATHPKETAVMIAEHVGERMLAADRPADRTGCYNTA